MTQIHNGPLRTMRGIISGQYRKAYAQTKRLHVVARRRRKYTEEELERIRANRIRLGLPPERSLRITSPYNPKRKITLPKLAFMEGSDPT